MPLDFKVWLIEQARLDIFEKADVCEGLCQENKQEVVSLSLLNQAIQQEVALWNKKAIAAKAHLMPLDFQVWVIEQARQDIFEKKDVADMLYKKNPDNKLVLSTLQFSLQKQVADFDPIKTCQSVALMDEAFNEWLHCEVENHRWEQTSVFRVLKKEKVDGKTVVSAIVKPGNLIYLYVESKNIFFQFAVFELSTTGPSGGFHGDAMGRFELVGGKERGGGPVYRQVHSREVPRRAEYELYR